MLAFIVFLTFSQCYFAFAESPEWIVFDKSNSILKDAFIYDIEIDKEENIWIATSDRDDWNKGGLIFTDRLNWQIFNSKNSDFPSDRLYKIEIDKLENIWITTSNKGVFEFNDGTLKIYDTTNSPLLWQNTIDIAVDSNNVKWFANVNEKEGGGLMSYDNEKWRVYDSNDVEFPKKGYVNSVFVDKNNDKWIGYFETNYIYKFDDETWTVYDTLSKWNRRGEIRAFARDSVGNLWIGWDEPVKFTGTNWLIYFIAPRSSINTIAVESNNDIWFGSNVSDFGGMMKFSGNKWTVYDPTNSPLPGNTVNKIVIDKFGNKWIATRKLTVYKEGGVVGITDVEDDKKMEKDKILCYPNPTEGNITIRYRIEKYSEVNLYISDILGNRIELRKENKFPGDYIEEYNLSHLPNGIYFATVNGGTEIITKQFVIMR
jgi:ligand-binding sensor domain-containing protein